MTPITKTSASNNNLSKFNLATKCIQSHNRTKEQQDKESREKVTTHQKFIHLVRSNNYLHLEERDPSTSLSKNFFTKRYKRVKKKLTSTSFPRAILISTIFLNLFLWPRDSIISLSNVFANCFPTLESNPRRNQSFAFDFLRVYYFGLSRFTQIVHRDSTSHLFPFHRPLSKKY